MIVRELITRLGFKVDTEKIAAFDKSVTALKGRLTGAAMGVAGLGMSAVGLAYTFKSAFLDIAAQFEKFETMLMTTEGSSEKARKAMDWISDFAAKTPYELAEVTDAFAKLRGYGLDPTQGLLQTLGDTSAAMTRPLASAVEAIADAVMGQNERLLNFQIRGEAKGQQVAYRYTDKAGKARTKLVKRDAKEIEKALTEIWAEKFGGSMDRLSKTWGGVVSNLSDQWSRFARMVMESGPFERLKKQLVRLLSTLDKMAAEGKLKEYAEKVGAVFSRIIDLAVALVPKVINLAKWFRDLYSRLEPIINRMGGFEAVIRRVAIVLGTLYVVSLTRDLILFGQAALVAARSLTVLTVAQVPLTLVAASVLALALMIEDLATEAEGGKSVIGDFFAAFKGQDGVLGAIATALSAARDSLLEIQDVNLGEPTFRIIPDEEGTTWLYEIMQLPYTIRDAFVELGTWLGESAAKMWLAFRDAAVEAVTAIGTAIRDLLGGALVWASDRVRDLSGALTSAGQFLRTPITEALGFSAPVALPPIPIMASAGAGGSGGVSVSAGDVSVQVAATGASPEQIGTAVQGGVMAALEGAIRRARTSFAGREE